MVLAMEPRVLMLDEPTAGPHQARTQRDRRASWCNWCATHGLCILLIEHDLEFVREISSRIIVLHQGRIVLDGTR